MKFLFCKELILLNIGNYMQSLILIYRSSAGVSNTFIVLFLCQWQAGYYRTNYCLSLVQCSACYYLFLLQKSLDLMPPPPMVSKLVFILLQFFCTFFCTNGGFPQISEILFFLINLPNFSNNSVLVIKYLCGAVPLSLFRQFFYQHNIRFTARELHYLDAVLINFGRPTQVLAYPNTIKGFLYLEK